MSNNNYYDILWVSKNASAEELKKAYKKKAMEHHPDRNKWNKDSEAKFKKINEAYDTLWDTKKKQQYDMFGSSWWNPFEWWSPNSWFWGYEDIFWWAWRQQQSSGFNFNMEDLFWWAAWAGSSSQSSYKKEKPVSLDFEKTYEVPIFDLILGCKIEVKWVYGNTAKLKIPASTKPWAKFRVKWFGKKEPGREWNLIVKIEAIMPKHISEVDISMLERIRENIGY